MGLSIKEAAKLVRKSTRTIKAWRADGIDVTNPEELIEHSQLKDVRARGSSAILARRRAERTPTIPPSPPLRSFFEGVSQDEPFVELPLPCDPHLSERVLDAVGSIRDAFLLRVTQLKEIGAAHNIALAEKDLQAITESHRLLASTLEGFEVSSKA